MRTSHVEELWLEARTARIAQQVFMSHLYADEEAEVGEHFVIVAFASTNSAESARGRNYSMVSFLFVYIFKGFVIEEFFNLNWKNLLTFLKY